MLLLIQQLFAQPYPNIVLLSIDTFRSDCVEAYNSDSIAKTPHINALAKDGVVYEYAYSPISVTGPAFTSLLTGKNPQEHHVFTNYYLSNIPLSSKERTITESLVEQGYSTGAFVSAFTLDAELGLAKGFQIYDDNVGAKQRRRGEKTRINAIKWLSTVDNNPFFLWYHSFDNHGPLYLWLPDEEQPIIGMEKRIPTKEQQYFAANQFFKQEADPEVYKALYAKAVEYSDAQIGEMIRVLKEKDLYTNALIIVVSDHGETFTERVPWFGHGDHASEEQLHVPLIIKYPQNIMAGQRDVHLHTLKDVSKTIVSWAGVKNFPSSGLELHKKHSGWELLLGESSHCADFSRPRCFPLGVHGKSFSIREQTKELLYYPQQSSDIWDWNNVNVQPSTILEQYWKSKIRDAQQYRYRFFEGFTETKPNYSKQTEQMLREIGYIE